MWTKAKNGEPIDIFRAKNNKDEALNVVMQIKNYLDGGIVPNKCAVLYRTNIQSRVIEEQLILKQIPYDVYGGLRFFARAEIKHTMSYLKLALNYHDDIAFERIVNFPPRGIGSGSYNKLKEYAINKGLSLWETITANNILKDRPQRALLDFMQLIIGIKETTQNLGLVNILDYIIKKSTLLEYYANSNNALDKNKVQNLLELVTAAKEYQNHYYTNNSTDLVNSFIDNSILDNDNREKKDYSGVQLMTIHSAKGLEFPYVFIIGLEENIFPAIQAQNDKKQINEERRLCYVAMTRAMVKLHMSFCVKRFLIKGGSIYLQPSRFLSELSSKNLNIIDNYGIKNNINHIYKNKITTTGNKYKIGDTITHEKFGIGCILNYEGVAESERIKVNFKKYGIKWLIIAYAKITKISN